MQVKMTMILQLLTMESGWYNHIIR
jgi:hypothetical protein